MHRCLPNSEDVIPKAYLVRQFLFHKKSLVMALTGLLVLHRYATYPLFSACDLYSSLHRINTPFIRGRDS